MSVIVVPQRRLWLPQLFAKQFFKSGAGAIYRNSGGNIIYDEQSKLEECCCEVDCAECFSQIGEGSSVSLSLADYQNASCPCTVGSVECLYENLIGGYSLEYVETIGGIVAIFSVVLGESGNEADPGIKIHETATTACYVWEIRCSVSCGTCNGQAGMIFTLGGQNWGNCSLSNCSTASGTCSCCPTIVGNWNQALNDPCIQEEFPCGPIVGPGFGNATCTSDAWNPYTPAVTVTLMI